MVALSESSSAFPSNIPVDSIRVVAKEMVPDKDDPKKFQEFFRICYDDGSVIARRTLVTLEELKAMGIDPALDQLDRTEPNKEHLRQLERNDRVGEVVVGVQPFNALWISGIISILRAHPEELEKPEIAQQLASLSPDDRQKILQGIAKSSDAGDAGGSMEQQHHSPLLIFESFLEHVGARLARWSRAAGL